MNLPLILFLLFTMPLSLYAKISILKTKLSQEMIRYIDAEGKFTYYQKKDGSLYLSSNYDVKKILEGNPNTFYQIIEGDDFIVIQENKNYFNHLSLNKNSALSISKIGSKTITKIGEGSHPKLHLKDRWLSYFDYNERKIKFHLRDFPEKNFSIKVKNNYPNFSPIVEMLNEQTILYTDYNDVGESLIYLFDKVTKEFKNIYNSKAIGRKLEFCLTEKDLIVGEFDFHGNHGGSLISSIPNTGLYRLIKPKSLYSSKLSDIGHMDCLNQSKIYFLKTTKQVKKLNYKESDLFSLEISSKKIKQITKFGDIYNYFKMSNQIYIPRLEQYYVLGAKSDFSDDSLKKEDKEKGDNDASP
ncbi:hypothetical protein N9N67_06345 [Bacteriovoracaceae bacterium]|nr:hypothetical protein [Bacteriovoracaceae bacterium]